MLITRARIIALNLRIFSFRRCSILILSLCLSLKIIAQEPAYIHYEVHDGLPTSQVYQSIQDQRGYMWFATDQGLVRFNGYNFKTFTQKDGLGSDVVFGFYKDRLKRIWLYTYAGGISYLLEDSIVTPSFNSALSDSLGTLLIGSMSMDTNGTIWLASTRNELTVSVTKSGEIKKTEANMDSVMFHVTEIDSEEFIFGRGSSFKHKCKPKLAFNSINGNHIFDLPAKSQYPRNGGMAIKKQRLFYFKQNRMVVSFSDSGLIRQALLPGNTTMSLTFDHGQNIWLGMYQEGAIYFKSGDLEANPKRYLNGYSVSSIYQDKEGGYWFTTLFAGIFYASSLNMHSKKLNEDTRIESISAIHVDSTSIWIGTEQGNVYEYIQNRNSYNLLHDNLIEIEFIYKTDSHRIIGFNWGAKIKFQSNDSTLFIPTRTASMDPTGNRLNCYNLNTMVNFQLPECTFIIKSNKAHNANTIQVISQWKGGDYIGGINGLFRVVGDDWIPCSGTDDLQITDLLPTKNFLYIATKNKGLIIYNVENGISINTKDGLPINHIQTITKENDSVLWLGSKRGVSRIYINQQSLKTTISNLNTNNGLISNEVNDLFYHSGKLWVGTNLGLTYFNTNESFKNSLPPPILIEEIRVNSIPHEANQIHSFPHTSNVFDFRFVGLNYRSNTPIDYRYRLKGLETEWHQTNNREVSYILSSGTYTFEVLAKNNSGVWSKAPATFDFEIQVPFWKRTWFILAVIALTIIISILLIHRRLKVINRRNQLELQIAKSQQAALIAQLRPHFIFNALNSINNFIRKNDKESSSKYLTLFSTLIRQILINSNKSIISIEQEISLLEKYLQVEQLRFKDHMTYSIKVNSGIDQKTLMIPTQIIQPYVENAIWHGIMNKSTGGHIKLELQIINDMLHCTIEDNGVGRQASAQMGQESYHKSTGMEMGKQRLKLVESIIKQPVSISIIDLKDANNKPIGTQIKLILPIIQA